MASMDYDNIFNNFIGDMTDYSLASLSATDAYELMTEWLHKAISRPYIRNLFSSVTLQDDVQILNFEMRHVVDEESDFEFVAMILGKQMVREWIAPKVKSTTNVLQFFGTKEQKFYSQKEMLNELRSMEKEIGNDVRKMIRDRGYIWNPYLEG